MSAGGLLFTAVEQVGGSPRSENPGKASEPGAQGGGHE